MNAPVRIVDAEVLGDIEDFRLCCAEHRFFLDLGILALPIAVDNLQWLAERWGLIDLHGQDVIQSEMASALRVVHEDIPLAPVLPGDFVREWELADPRDAWRHTGELPPKASPPPAPTPRPHRTPEATLNAFWHVVRLDNAEHMRAWLAQHPLDAAYVLKIWERKDALSLA